MLGCGHATGGAPPAPVVEDLQVLEQGVGELDGGAPPLPVEQLGLDPPPEELGQGVVVGFADGADRGLSPRHSEALDVGPVREDDLTAGRVSLPTRLVSTSELGPGSRRRRVSPRTGRFSRQCRFDYGRVLVS